MPRYRTSFFINPAESEGFLRNPNKLPLAIIVRAKRDKKIACNNRQSAAAENSRSGCEKAL